MGPTQSQVHINRPLSQMMISYQQNSSLYVASKVFPVINTQHMSDLYFIMGKEAFLRADAQERAPNTESAGIEYGITTGQYLCKVYAAHHDLSDQVRNNFDAPLQAEQSSIRLISDNLMLKQEKVFADTFMRPGVWKGGAGLNGSSDGDFDVTEDGHGAWNTDSSDPMADITDAQSFAMSQTGRMLDQLTLTRDAYDALRNNRSILDRIKYTQRGVITEDILAAVLGVKRINVLQAVINANQSGQPSKTGYLASNGFLLTYSPETPSTQDASAGYIFTCTSYLGAQGLAANVSSFRMEHLKATRIEGESAWDMRITAPDLGVFGKNVIAPKA